jgi:hypothetical protein
MEEKKESTLNPDDKNILLNILYSIDLICEITKGYSYERHVGNLILQDSITYRIASIQYGYDKLSKYTRRVINEESNGLTFLVIEGLKWGIPYEIIYKRLIKEMRKFKIEEQDEYDYIEEDYEIHGTYQNVYDSIERAYFKLFEPENYQEKLKGKESNEKVSPELSTDY